MADERATVNYIGWSKERGFHYTRDGAYVRREDYDALLAVRAASSVPATPEQPLEAQKGRVDCPRCGSPASTVVIECCDCGQQWYLHCADPVVSPTPQGEKR